MMLIKIIAVGRMKERALAELTAGFQKRLGAYAKVEMVEIADSNIAGEGAAILRELDREKHSRIIAMAEEGKEFTTGDFAARLAACDSKVVFIIGGPFGLAPEVKAKAGELLALSKMTFTHEMARFLLLEQLYRALNLNAGGRYHHW